MNQDLIQAAENLKAAAEALLEIAVRPIIDFSSLSDEQKEALRSLINPWLESEYKEQLASLPSLDDIKGVLDNRLEDFVGRDVVEEMIDDGIRNAESDIGAWNEIDPEEVKEALATIARYDIDNMSDVCEAMGNVDFDDVERAAELAGKVDEVETELEDLANSLKPLLDMLDVVRKAARPKPVSAV